MSIITPLNYNSSVHPPHSDYHQHLSFLIVVWRLPDPSVVVSACWSPWSSATTHSLNHRTPLTMNNRADRAGNRRSDSEEEDDIISSKGAYANETAVGPTCHSEPSVAWTENKWFSCDRKKIRVGHDIIKYHRYDRNKSRMGSSLSLMVNGRKRAFTKFTTFNIHFLRWWWFQLYHPDTVDCILYLLTCVFFLLNIVFSCLQCLWCWYGIVTNTINLTPPVKNEPNTKAFAAGQPTERRPFGATATTDSISRLFTPLSKKRRRFCSLPLHPIFNSISQPPNQVVVHH